MNNNVSLDYLIIGAGPAGIQMGYFMDQAGLNYRIVEKGEQPGHFFKKYPRHRKLISINKVFTGIDDDEKNLRWDWNSLLGSDAPLFKEYSSSYFPSADDYLHYLDDFSKKFQLRIDYNTVIDKISKPLGFIAKSSCGKAYKTKRIIVATGVSRLYFPDIEGIELAETYETFSVNPTDYENQDVLIIGKGNSGFETADNLIESAAKIHIASPNPIKLAWSTKFVGNLRAVNNNFLDTYQLKSQNAILDGNIRSIQKYNNKYIVTLNYSHAKGEVEELVYDRVLICTGFKFDASIFDDGCKPELSICDRFPKMNEQWESSNIRDLFFAGTITQQRDYRKTASGFIHGFRYNVRSLFRFLEDRFEQKPWPYNRLVSEGSKIVERIISRVNRSSGLWQQYGFLCDIVSVNSESGYACYWEEMPKSYAEKCFVNHDHYYVITLEFGDITSDPFSIERNPDPDYAADSVFLHPVIRRFKSGMLIAEHHLLEDLHSDWSRECHIEPLCEFINAQLKSLSMEKLKVE
ncbi:NAD(P)-binding domain-containing protein [Microbulbifer epialgicus]|uniref:NAD(P)-binding domain-containing protein n=1 Tax=Microbulbifer epialgicus TaxID=393907 RepID=A0ABV4P558_9GAMM